MTSEGHSFRVLFVGGAAMASLAADVERVTTFVGFRIECMAARTDSDALEALARSDAALAVVDMTVHGLGGADGWRRTRTAWLRSIIVLCAEEDDACARAALADGAEDALRNDPCTPVQLGHAITRALARGHDVRPDLQLRDLQERWQALDAASSWYVMEIDDADRIMYLNRSGNETPAEAFRGSSVFTFTHPSAHAEVRARLEHVRRTGEAVTVEERGHGTLGDDTWFVARCLPVKRDERVRSILVVTEDVSERHRMQLLVANSERRFRALIEKSSDAIVLLDGQGRALYASPATLQLLGFAPEEIVGCDFMERVHPEDVPSVLEAGGRLRALPGGHVVYEVRLRHKDGSWRHVHATDTNLVDDAAVGAFVGNYRDMTVQRALEEQVRRAQQWEAIGLLAGGIAHDFNNLLCIIMTAASGAASSGQLPAAGLEDINLAAGRAGELTRKLLSLSRKLPLAPEYLDAGDIIATFASLLRRSLGEDIEMVITCERPLPFRVDRLQIEQVLLNICTNAQQATQGRGRVEIDGRCREVPAIDGRGAERVVEIVVRDDGPGMDEATRRRVFDPFFTTKREGSGLGLTVSEAIVQRHGGSMSIESEPGRGTAVTVRLPAQDGPRNGPASRAPRVAAVVSHVRILIAEDESPLRRSFSRVLRAEGYDVVEAEDGEVAVAKFAGEGDRLALVILDVRLPRLSGPAAYERMARQRPGLPVLFVTGHAPDSEAIPRGAPLLAKPFTTDTLLRAVESARGAPARSPA